MISVGVAATPKINRLTLPRCAKSVMRIACVQFDSKLGTPQINIRKANDLIERHVQSKVDVLVLPETAFTGYNFKSIEHIDKHLEPTLQGITSIWAKETAARLSCIVIAGYPERSGETRYNAVVIARPDGTLSNYRKHFLYTIDLTWATSGPGFSTFNFPFGKARVSKLDGILIRKSSVGICMDMNNGTDFSTPFEAYELGTHITTNEIDYLLLPTAWLAPEDMPDDPKVPSMSTISYWAERLRPVWNRSTGNDLIFVSCNRIGEEDDCRYAGSSCVLRIKPGHIELLGKLGSAEEAVLTVDV
ncbi:Protein N-terminal amidase [Neolecta irregularis DAH-3]|uniref:Protein N-terminal amidase n=1 Tax=Neolecta irregularis (strain DAH-3) TaxID=1198029 RepID=A0A1U7LWA0_NEOID|nr:Protein N-terminal amidase [Neolecta irregularis DAH-3]|eukprot:OLL26955.1 Protein N-terminal amidase [Neolecta irregularis DAH-3]